MEVLCATIALVILWIVFLLLYHKRDRKDWSAPLIQREPLRDKGLRKFKVVFYHRCMRAGRFLRRAREVECVYVTDCVWAVDEGAAIKKAQMWQRALENASRIEVIDWSY